jgi:phage N-6-adenine-methyltransferase
MTMPPPPDTTASPSGDLDIWSRADQMLAEIATAADAVDLINYAEAARILAQRAGYGVRYENRATEIKVCAEIKLAEVIDAGQAAGVIAKPGSAKGNQRTGKVLPAHVTTLDSAGVTKERVRDARKMRRQYTPEKIRAIAAEATAQDRTISRKDLLNGQIVQQSLTNEWYTPPRYVDAARLVVGGEFDLDPASNPQANLTVGARVFYTKDDDGLEQPWHGRVWLNPPYGRVAGEFIDRLCEEYRSGNVTAAVTLVNAHCTDTRWFQPLWDHTLCFTDHRIDFTAGTTARSGSTHGSVFAYLGTDPALFAKHFAEFGAVVRRWP